MHKKLETTKLLTVKQVSEMTGWSESTVRQKVWLRQLEYIKLNGRSIRFELATIQRLIDEGRVPVLPNHT
jgi:excisionase family DNA binding protein